MREIKFRAWDKLGCKMFIVDDILFPKKPAFRGAINDYPFPSCELMQSTGLKDKNGKEVYEGDLLRCSDGTSKDWITHVQFDNGCWHRYKDYRYSEIIGNIYENPELLNK